MPNSEQTGQATADEGERWYRASHYASEQQSQRPYREAQAVLFKQHETELSAYRFNLDAVYHVAVLGGQPAEAMAQLIERVLSSGEAAKLPEEVLDALFARQKQARQIGPWVEGHYDETVAPRIPLTKKGKRRKR